MWNQIFWLFAQIDLGPLPGSGNSGTGGANSAVPVIKNIVFAIFGITAVLIIVIAGFQYILSQGDSQKVARAKDTIIYAVVGLIITMISYSIVTFVIDRI